MKSSIYFRMILVSFIILFQTGVAQDSTKNTKYLIESIDLDNKKFSPAEPENEFQEVMAKYMSDLMELNSNTNKLIQQIGAFEFESMSDLSSIENIKMFKENLKQYKSIKKAHYDKLDSLMREANTKIGKTDLAQKRLGGSSQYYEERLELFFLYDLDKYYDFLLKNHERFNFEGDEIYGTDEALINQYNILRNKMVNSANNINRIQDFKNNLLKDRMEELRDWIKNN